LSQSVSEPDPQASPSLAGSKPQESVSSLQTPSLQTFPVHVGAVPAWQSLTASQVSIPLQKAPSLQTELSGVLTQVSLASSQVSVVQITPSLQFGAVPA
jgi:hypothetical protein